MPTDFQKILLATHSAVNVW